MQSSLNDGTNDRWSLLTFNTDARLLESTPLATQVVYTQGKTLARNSKREEFFIHSQMRDCIYSE